MADYDFLAQVRDEFADVVAAHGLREVHVDRLPIFKHVVYSNGRRMIDFSLDFKDGYITCRYGDASILRPDGIPRWPESERLGSVNALLRRDGMAISEGLAFEYERVPEAVRTLIAGIRHHEREVFGGG